jgi:hypothetical protein
MPSGDGLKNLIATSLSLQRAVWEGGKLNLHPPFVALESLHRTQLLQQLVLVQLLMLLVLLVLALVLLVLLVLVLLVLLLLLTPLLPITSG